MPFRSKAQVGKFFELEKQGKLPKGKAEQWASETPDIKSLPARVKKKSGDWFERALPSKSSLRRKK